ncbi:MAG: histidine phosphatase family protein [Anaerolineales bacterium]|mgnify:CR=1 FL=1|nr:histidine phosphatase family protein [Anaerolineales bacterium]
MRLYIVRHGEKEEGSWFNPELHHADPPLTERGTEQARALCRYFAEISVGGILVSRYVRTGQTAAFVAEQKGLAPVVDARLDEIDNGYLDSMSNKEIAEQYPDFWQVFRSFSCDVRFPGGETGEEVKQRQDSLLNELEAKGDDMLLVTHEGWMRLLCCNVMGMPVYRRNRFRLDYCGIVEMQTDKEAGGWKMLCINRLA